MSRMDVIAFRTGQSGKPYAVRLGSAVPRKNGEGFTLYLDAIPAPDNGQWVLSVVPPRDQGNRPQPAPQRESGGTLPDDRIPF